MLSTLKSIIRGYLSWIKYHFCKSYRQKREKEAKRRIKICENCQFFWKPARNCMVCGCFCDVKVIYEYDLDENGISIDGCYEKKW